MRGPIFTKRNNQSDSVKAKAETFESGGKALTFGPLVSFQNSVRAQSLTETRVDFLKRRAYFPRRFNAGRLILFDLTDRVENI